MLRGEKYHYSQTTDDDYSQTYALETCFCYYEGHPVWQTSSLTSLNFISRPSLTAALPLSTSPPPSWTVTERGSSTTLATTGPVRSIRLREGLNIPTINTDSSLFFFCFFRKKIAEYKAQGRVFISKERSQIIIYITFFRELYLKNGDM